MTFCELKKDEKTYDHIKKYIMWFSQHKGEGFLNLDANIQLGEIKNYLKINSYDDKNDEILYWVTNYSKEFRIYLNTLKIIFTIWHCSGNLDIPSWSMFCNIIDKLCEIKSFCLDEIMIDGNPKTLDME